MPPTPQPSTPSPLIIVVCESVPTSESGYATLLSVFGSDEHRLAEVLEIHLVADAGAGRHDAEVLERVLSPPQEDVALLVALELELGVDQERGLRAVLVHLDRVVDDEIDRLERIDALRVAAERRDGVAHRGEIDDGGDAGEVLQQYAAVRNAISFSPRARHVPFGEREDVVVLDERVVLVSQQVLQQDLETERQAAGVAAGRLVEGGEAVDDVLLAVDGKRRPAPEGILGCHWTCLSTRGFWPSEVTDGATGGTRTSTARLRTNLTRPDSGARASDAPGNRLRSKERRFQRR